ncbi:MAG: hypothetical protein GC164_15205 [Phycisphaera sp.]|nr:hypothetical protein [Phycisphaera sp.]
MNHNYDDPVQMIPIEQINVVNTRSRGQEKFKEIIASIKALGLKKPITVTPASGKYGPGKYDLVCGEGRVLPRRGRGVPSSALSSASGFRKSLIRNRLHLHASRNCGAFCGASHFLSSSARVRFRKWLMVHRLPISIAELGPELLSSSSASSSAVSPLLSSAGSGSVPPMALRIWRTYRSEISTCLAMSCTFACGSWASSAAAHSALSPVTPYRFCT